MADCSIFDAESSVDVGWLRVTDKDKIARLKAKAQELLPPTKLLC